MQGRRPQSRLKFFRNEELPKPGTLQRFQWHISTLFKGKAIVKLNLLLPFIPIKRHSLQRLHDRFSIL